MADKRYRPGAGTPRTLEELRRYIARELRRIGEVTASDTSLNLGDLINVDNESNPLLEGQGLWYDADTQTWRNRASYTESFPTGLADGGELNIVSGEIEALPGVGLVIDSYTDPLAPPTPIALQWDRIQEPITAAPPVAGSVVWFSIENTGVPVGEDIGGTPYFVGQLRQWAQRPNPTVSRQQLFLGLAIHNGDTWAEASNPKVLNQSAETLREVLTAVFGPTVIIQGGAVNEQPLFTLEQEEGTLWEQNRNWHRDKSNPNREVLPAANPIQFRYTNRDFSDVGTLTPTVDPTQWDNNGVVEPIPGSGNQTTIQRLYFDIAGDYWVLWGQEIYSTFDTAVANLQADNPVVPLLLQNSILLGYIVSEKAQTDWVTNEAIFIAAESGATQAGAGAPITEHDNLLGITPDNHHNQVHLLYGPDHSDVDTGNTPVDGDYLGYDGTNWTALPRRLEPGTAVGQTLRWNPAGNGSWEPNNTLTVGDDGIVRTSGELQVAGRAVAAHIDNGDIHFTQSQIDHTAIQNVGVNTHAQIDSHIADGSIHFTQSQIDHTAIQNVGTNTHAQIDSHIADGSIHYLQTAIDHTVILNRGTNTHAQIDSHIADGNIHFADAPNDGNYYARRGQSWQTDPIFSGGGQGAGWVPDPGPNIRGYFLEDSGNFEPVPIQPVSTPTAKYNNLGTISAGDPGSGNIGVNNADPALVTEGYASALSRGGNDLSFLWRRVDRGDILAAFATGGNSNVNFWRVTATPTDNGTWFLVPVEAVDFSGPLPSDEIEIYFISRQVQDGTADGQMLVWDEDIDRLWTPTNAITVDADSRVRVASGDLRGGTSGEPFEIRQDGTNQYTQIFGGNDSQSARLSLSGSARSSSTKIDFYEANVLRLSYVPVGTYWHFRDQTIDYAAAIRSRLSTLTTDYTQISPSALQFNRSVSYIDQIRDGGVIQFRMSNGGDRNVNSATINEDGAWRFRVNRILVGENNNDEAFVSVRDNRAQFGYDGSSAFMRGGSTSNPKGLQFEVGDGTAGYRAAAYFSPSSLEWNFFARKFTRVGEYVGEGNITVTRTSPTLKLTNGADSTTINDAQVIFNRSLSYIDQARDGATLVFRMSNGGDRNVFSAEVNANGRWDFQRGLTIDDSANPVPGSNFTASVVSAFGVPALQMRNANNNSWIQILPGVDANGFTFLPDGRLLLGSAGDTRIQRLSDPTADTDAANKRYVDGARAVAVAGISGSSGGAWGPVVGCTFTKITTGNYSLTLNNPLPFAGAWHCSISTDSEAEPYVTGFFTDGSTSNVRIYVKNAANQFVDPSRVTVMVYDKSKYQ